MVQIQTGPVMAQGFNAPIAALRVLESPAGGVEVEWAREAGPSQLLGWYVDRLSPDGGVVRLTEERVEAGVFDPPDCLYRVRDAAVAARPGGWISYRLVAVDLELREWPSPFAAYEVEAEETAVLPIQAKLPRPKPEPAPRALVISGVGDRVRITVTNNGLYRLTAAQIATVLAGFNEAQVAQAIAQTNLALSCGGEAVAWRAETNGTALLFFGQAYRDLYTDRNVYWLAPGAGLAMAASNRATATVAADPWFWETTRMERNNYYLSRLPGGVEDDYFVWDGKQLGAPATNWTWTTNVALVDLHTNMREGTVTAFLIGGYDGVPEFDNHSRLSAAGQLLNDHSWAGNERLAQSGAATNLSGSQVAVTLELRRETNVTTTTVMIDALEVRYARRLRALNNQLLFLPEAGTNTLTVRGFTTSAIQVFDVTEPLSPVAVSATVAQEGTSNWRASWSADPAVTGRFLVVSTNLQPERIEGVANAEWGGAMPGAPHLVIAPQALTNAAAALVTYRSGQGLDSLLVPLEAIYDNFAYGRRDPRAIPRFLGHALAQWTIPPAYVCLAGDGHIDYLDYFNQSATRPNHIPPMKDRLLYHDNDGNWNPRTFGVDNPLGDIDGNGDPDVAIGRLPAQTPAALTRMINRIVAHESSETWKNKVLLVADKDEFDSFGLAIGRLAERVPPGMVTTQLNHNAHTTAVMSNKFIEAMNAGYPLSIYIGHGNNNGLSSPYFFEHSYLRSCMPLLTNSTRAPLLLAGTCMLNDYADPQTTSRCQGKGFLDTATGGAVAVWASVAESSLINAEETTAAILDKLFENNDARLGDLIRPALDLEFQSFWSWLVRASILMGDPGTRIRTYLFLDHLPPAIQITSPTTGVSYVASTNYLDLTGTASDDIGLKRVVVRNNRMEGESVATGTTSWSLAGLELAVGTNLIAAIAYDSAGNSATSTLQVVYSGDSGRTYENWAAEHFTPEELEDPSVSGQAADPDRDRLTNWQEFLAWTDPKSADSVLQITAMRKVSEGLELCWSSVTGQYYRLALSDSLNNLFLPLEGDILATNEISLETLPIDFQDRKLFFQVILVGTGGE